MKSITKGVEKMSDSNIKHIVFHSALLNKSMGINVYLPPAYEEHKNPLPVLYFLHGRSGNENILFDLNIHLKADEMIAQQKINPLIIVCPRIENSRGINSSPLCKEIVSSTDTVINIGMYEDYFIKEVVPLIDKQFNTICTKSGRYIGGVSAGGYAALHFAFRHQELFCKVGGHMPSIELGLEQEDAPYFPNMSIWEKYDPVTIARTTNLSKELSVYLDAGDQDEGHFYEGCKILQNILEEKGVTSQNHLFQGHHDATYISSHLEKYLEFYNT